MRSKGFIGAPLNLEVGFRFLAALSLRSIDKLVGAPIAGTSVVEQRFAIPQVWKPPSDHEFQGSLSADTSGRFSAPC